MGIPTEAGAHYLRCGKGCTGPCMVDVYKDDRAGGQPGLRIQGPQSCGASMLRPFETEPDWWLDPSDFIPVEFCWPDGTVASRGFMEKEGE